ncbi:MAG: AI-2E family transporter [Bdellovibrionota bacterium]
MSESRKIEISIPLRTYLIFFAVLAGVAALYLLAPIILLVYLSLLMAVTLTSLERYLMRRGWRKLVADTVLIVLLLSFLSVIFFVIIPSAATQMKEVLVKLPALEAQFEHMASPEIRKGANRILGNSPTSLNRMWSQVSVFANNTLSGILKFGLMMIISFYMLLEGPKAYAWILAFFSAGTRRKIDETAKEISPIVESYIIGQAITSTLAALWVFTTAYYLGVPAALTLAVLAAVFDILPGLGFLLNTVTGCILALTVSMNVAFFFFISLLVYMLIENYMLIPYIYGRRMKLSPLVVLTSLIFAGAVAGIPGMIGILPIVASFGPIERRWLKHHEDFQEAVSIHEDLKQQTSTDLARESERKH